MEHATESGAAEDSMVQKRKRVARGDPSMSLVRLNEPGPSPDGPKEDEVRPRAAPSRPTPFHCPLRGPKSH